MENQIKDEQQKKAESENFLNSETSKFENFSKNFSKKTEDLQAIILELQERNFELSAQNTELNNHINGLKHELFDLQTIKAQLEHKNEVLEAKLKESLSTLYEQTSVSNRNMNDLHNEKSVL